MSLIPRRARGREGVPVGMPKHGATAAVAGPVITGPVVTRRKRRAVHLGPSQYIVLRKIGVPVNA